MKRTDGGEHISESKDAQKRFCIAQAYTLLVTAQTRTEPADPRLDTAVTLVWQLHDELTPDPLVNNPQGRPGWPACIRTDDESE